MLNSSIHKLSAYHHATPFPLSILPLVGKVSFLLKCLFRLLGRGFQPLYPSARVRHYSNSGELTSGMPIKYLTRSEVERFFRVIKSPRDRALFATIYHYGLRVTEATLLRHSDVDFKRDTIYIHRVKGGQGGIKPLLPNTAKVLQAYLAVRASVEDALFIGREGNLQRHRVQQLFKKYAQQVGLGRYSVHSLRHSIATHMLEAGFELEVVRDHLGHRNIQSTLIYAQITDKHRLEAFQKIEASTEIVKL